MDAATRRWIKSPADEAAAVNGCYFDEAAAEKVERFFRQFLRHSKGRFAGQPFELLEWQRDDVVFPMFGWKRADGRRRFQRAYVEIPKKNGKSTLAAGLGLYLLVGDNEPGAEVYSAACTRQQAGIVHGEAINMVRASQGLSTYLRVHGATREIRFDARGAVYKALAADANSNEGLNIHGLIIDELHAWPGEAGRAFYNALKWGGKARENPLFFIITTAGEDQLSIGFDVHNYARGVLDGSVEDQRFFAYVRAADSQDDYREPATWRKANPSLGHTMTEDDFAADVKEAEQSPTSLTQFKRYALNIWAQGGTSAIDQNSWKACRVKFKEADLHGERCFGAIDLARVSDLTAAGLVFPRDGGRYRALVQFWLPRAKIEHPNTPEMFRVWERQGLIVATDGDVTDYEKVRADVAEWWKRFELVEFAYDPWMAEEFSQRLSDDGFERVSFGQTILNYAAPSAEFERLIVGRLLEHDGNPFLAWQIGNLRWRIDPAGNRRPDKARERNKIDGPVALIMAIARAMVADESAGGDVGISSF
jgi:phage terminase large subunit-like protein